MRLSPGILKLAVLLVGLPIILWLAAFSKTMSLYGEYRNLSKSEVADSVSLQRVTVSCENRLAGDCLIREILTGENEVIINEYAPSVEKSDGGLSIVRARLQLRGRFIPLLKVVHHLENQPEISLADICFSHKTGKDPLVTLDLDLIQLVGDE